jgi:pimeloyl-ACP methyl ester carboxylesterase
MTSRRHIVFYVASVFLAITFYTFPGVLVAQTIFYESFTGNSLNQSEWTVVDDRPYKEPGSSLVVNDQLIITRGPNNNNNGWLGIVSRQDFSAYVDNVSYEVDFMVDDVANWQDNPLEFGTPLGVWGFNNYSKGGIAYNNKAGQIIQRQWNWDGTPALSQLIPYNLYKFKIETRDGKLRFLFDQSDGQGYVLALETDDYSAPYYGNLWDQQTWQGRIILANSDRGASFYDNVTIKTLQKPFVIVVPGLGASTLRDASNTDQWLSCTSILSLNNQNFTPMQYDSDGNPLFTLQPTSILTQNDAISNVVKPSNQSVVQCDNASLLSVAGASNWIAGAFLSSCLALPPVERSCMQNVMVDFSGGTLLQFNSLLSRLTNEGYDWATWPYDFRRDISALADDLYNKIQSLSSQYPAIAIVTHSMGSIITEALLQKYPNISYHKGGSLQYVISMGAPFKGAMQSYLAAQGREQFVPFMGTADTGTLGGNWTSVYDLLPQWEFVPGISNNQIYNGTASCPGCSPSLFPALPRTNALPGAYSLWNTLSNPKAFDHWYAIVGFGKATEIFMEPIIPQTQKTCYRITKYDGDGTVPILSSQNGSIVPEDQYIYVQEEHGKLPGNASVQNGIIKILQGVSPFGDNLKTIADVPSFGFTYEVKACSPIDLVVTNSAGQVVGNKGIEIAEATYTRPDGSAQIDIPAGDSYTVQAFGTGLGTFDLVFLSLDNNMQTTQTYAVQGIAAPGSLVTYKIASVGNTISTISLVATFEGTLADVANALALGLIDDQEIANSLYQELLAAQSANGQARNNILNTFLSEVNSQSGKHITGIAPQVFINDANSLFLPSCAANVTNQLSITRSGFTFNFATGRFSQTLTLKNAGSSAISSPISLVLDSLSANATLYNGSGTTSCAAPMGSPYINASSAGLNPGASVSVVIQFTDPTKAAITYVLRVLAGNGTR